MNEDFSEWYKKTEKEYGSLITPAMAAKILNITNQHLNRIITSGRIKRYKYENNTYISIKEVEKEKEYRNNKNTKKDKCIELTDTEVEILNKLITNGINNHLSDSDSNSNYLKILKDFRNKLQN